MAPVQVEASERAALQAGTHTEPHRVLGAHPVRHAGKSGAVVRAFHPEARTCTCLLPDGRSVALEQLGEGLFGAFVPGLELPARYRLRFGFPDGNQWERDDPYCFLPSLGELDLHLLQEGNHRRLWEALGARACEHGGVAGVAFAVWAPNARRVSLVGDFNRWDGRLFPLRSLGASGIWELFVPGLSPGATYKYELLTQDGRVLLKADPVARSMELPPGTASRVFASSYAWGDETWMSSRRARDWPREAMAIYEVHLGSWARVLEEGDRPLSYRELAPRLAEHAVRLGFTHVELLPVMEHPFGGSWGYQVSAYFSPTSRYGSPDDFRFLVDTLHQHGLGVILDWVPAHFPRDDAFLAGFDGTALYEHSDPRLGAHPDWGTLIFNYGRHEVRNFLVANALYWLTEFHADALRVDAVASMLYLDYSRAEGEWLPNEHGGRENLAALGFLRQLNDTIAAECPGCFTIAEESTAWPGVTRRTDEGGLGFLFKWNMGWMHDTLTYFARDPIHRRFHQDQLSFAMIYEYSERFIMPLSHDEVVHGKGALLEKMPGDPWQKRANLRLLYTYLYTRPGKKLLFMGSELASSQEWRHDYSLDWHLAHDPERNGIGRLVEELGALYRREPALWRGDHDLAGFAWIDCNDHENSVLSYERRDDWRRVVVVLNLTPVPRPHYRVGAPQPGAYRLLLDTDEPEYGGSGYPTPSRLETEPTPWHGREHSLVLSLPPLAALVLQPEG